MVSIYEGQGMRYYVDYSTIVEPKRMSATEKLKRTKYFIECLNNANIKHLPYVSGFFVCLPCENAQELCDKLKEKHTYLVPMSDDIVRIAVCSLNKEEISELVEVLSEVL